MFNALEVLRNEAAAQSPFRHFNYWFQPSSYAHNYTHEGPYDLHEDEKEFVVTVDLPGVKKEDLKIDLTENVLTVDAQRKRGEESIQFQRQFSLPSSVDLEKIEANIEDGVLRIALPKAEKAKPRSIAINGK